MPSPQPPGHKLQFIDSYQTPTDASLALAWSITGPLVNSGACSVTVIDCNDEAPGIVYPDPRNPLLAPAVACPPRANSTDSSAVNATVPVERQPVLRVFYGTSCQLWRENAYNCSWDNIKQR